MFCINLKTTLRKKWVEHKYYEKNSEIKDKCKKEKKVVFWRKFQLKHKPCNGRTRLEHEERNVLRSQTRFLTCSIPHYWFHSKQHGHLSLHLRRRFCPSREALSSLPFFDRPRCLDWRFSRKVCGCEGNPKSLVHCRLHHRIDATLLQNVKKRNNGE